MSTAPATANPNEHWQRHPSHQPPHGSPAAALHPAEENKPASLVFLLAVDAGGVQRGCSCLMMDASAPANLAGTAVVHHLCTRTIWPPLPLSCTFPCQLLAISFDAPAMAHREFLSANHPGRFESFLLAPGEKKVEMKLDTRMACPLPARNFLLTSWPGMPNTSIFTFNKEDHTLGNLLRSKLLSNSHVTFAAYKVSGGDGGYLALTLRQNRFLTLSSPNLNFTSARMERSARKKRSWGLARTWSTN